LNGSRFGLKPIEKSIVEVDKIKFRKMIGVDLRYSFFEFFRKAHKY